MPPFNILESASPKLRRWLLVNGETKSFPAETVLIKEGECQPSPMVLLEGRLNVTTSNKQLGQEQLSSLTPGSSVGEMSWLEKRPAVADVVSATPCKVLELDVAVLDELSQSEPAIAAEWQRLVAKKLAAQIQSQNAWIHRYEGPGEEIEPLRKVLVLFAELNEQDVATLARIGSLRRIQPGDILLQQGQDVPSIFLILAGEAEIFVEIDGLNKRVGSSRRGELLGELTLLNSEAQGAIATVQSAG